MVMEAFIEEFSGIESMVGKFKDESIRTSLEGAEILLAWYGYGSYCGKSFVLWLKDGQLWENNANHCSCYGLEGQWDPEMTTIGALKKRNFSQCYEGSSEAQARLQECIEKIESAIMLVN